MKKLILLLAIVGLTSISYAQQKSETMKKTVVARLTIKKEAVESFVQFAQKIVEATRKESGCISYNLYKNTFGQEAEFIFYEEYKEQGV
jgi:quinol monooxygenase YgiN